MGVDVKVYGLIGAEVTNECKKALRDECDKLDCIMLPQFQDSGLRIIHGMDGITHIGKVLFEYEEGGSNSGDVSLDPETIASDRYDFDIVLASIADDHQELHLDTLPETKLHIFTNYS